MKNAGRGSNKKLDRANKKKHSKQDEKIIRLTQLGSHYLPHLRRHKKKLKFHFKDQIAALNSNLITDDIA